VAVAAAAVVVVLVVVVVVVVVVCCSVSLIFGAITCAAGIVGVAVGSLVASQLRQVTSKADPFVCAFGLLTSAPFLFFSLYLSCYNAIATWVSAIVTL